ncbi:GNAT family N-acetyltransferase [Tessaracoccus sp. OS52]|uniref:GNAT family N-acetyltransferase n=1 Tax=Tessaracoccus sp. OS52 TaxID=2886691 RepID=UPI001D0FE31E|nr:GNAT family N-acetyltransferase [Tessaracoccus sp. OS52]MCC2592269.1 GNAT family N-acetyltransferase [Tessaracoccus sp. OS52]
MIVEAAVASDLAGLVALEQWFPERERWSEQLWAEELAAQDRFVLVSRVDEDGAPHRVVGAATFQCVGDTADLHRVVVADGYRRRGFARVMLLAGLHWAKQSGASRMVLEVRQDNEVAIAFYRTYGFRDIGVRRDYYAAGANALVMELPLQGLDLDAIGLWGMEAAK